MEKLKLAAGMTGEQKRYAVEAALLLGFQTETATFPVITADGEIPVPENMEELKALWKKSTGGTLNSAFGFTNMNCHVGTGNVIIMEMNDLRYT